MIWDVCHNIMSFSLLSLQSLVKYWAAVVTTSYIFRTSKSILQCSSHPTTLFGWIQCSVPWVHFLSTMGEFPVHSGCISCPQYIYLLASTHANMLTFINCMFHWTPPHSFLHLLYSRWTVQRERVWNSGLCAWSSGCSPVRHN